MRNRTGLLALLASATLAVLPAAHAQQTPPALVPADGAPEPPASRKKIERIRIEDDAARIDELRYGGETQSITVQPKHGAPQYEIVPLDAARQRPQTGRDNSTTGTTGQRVWKVFGF